MNYKWSCTGFNADANKVGKEIEKLETKNGGVTREELLDYAKNNKESETYKCFEWNDSIAGEKYRLYQASSILNSISIIIKEEKPVETAKAFVNVYKTDETKIYKSFVKVLQNDEEYEQLLNKAERDFKSYKDKYSNLVKMKDLKDIIKRNI